MPESSDVVTIKLWPEGVPNAIHHEAYHEEVIDDSNFKRVTKVSDPELIVYLPSKEKANGTAVVICPGGGYTLLAIQHEGHDVASWLNALGVAAIVLKYRLPSDVIMEDKMIGPLQDVQEAIRIVRRNADEWQIKKNQIGILGFSAGGHLAGSASTLYNKNTYTSSDSTSARPDFSILIYGVLSMQQGITHMGSRENLLGRNPSKTVIDEFSTELNVTAETPPAFLVHSADDKAVNVNNSILYFQSLNDQNVPAELHIYQRGGHGYGMGLKGETESQWTKHCEAWLHQHGWL